MWKQIGVCPGSECGDRLWHAGLSGDGTKCFVAGFDDHVYLVWDIMDQRVLWKDDATEGDSPIESLEEWVDASGYVEITTGPAAGRYRVFGLNHGRAKTESNLLNQSLEVNVREGMVLVRDRFSGSVTAELTFDAFSGDWAFASFSDNDRTIAVLEPYSVTFYGCI
jgi:hypothetical protein